MTFLQERQRGAGAGAGGTGGGGGRGSGTGATSGGGTSGGGTSSGGTTGGGTRGGGGTGGGTTGGGKGGGNAGGGSKGGGSKGGGSTGSGSTGGGRGSSGSAGALPGTGAGAGAGGTGNNPKPPPSRPPTNPRTIGPGINFSGEPRLVSAYGRGGGLSTVIRVGEPFAGRFEGGGTRKQIFGTKTYGSGYTNELNLRGVAHRPFPFYFWPVVWGGAAIGGGVAYLDATDEYGNVTNTTRPGGPLSSAVFHSPSGYSTFRVISDNVTTTSLVFDLSNSCSSNFSANPAPISIPLNANAAEPRPEQAIQYYRGSSILLTLDGYSNGATYGPEGTLDTPLPLGVDRTLLNCLNHTIGKAAPLVDAPPGPVHTTGGSNAGMILRPYSSIDLVCLLFILWALIKSFR